MRIRMMKKIPVLTLVPNPMEAVIIKSTKKAHTTEPTFKSPVT